MFQLLAGSPLVALGGWLNIHIFKIPHPRILPRYQSQLLHLTGRFLFKANIIQILICLVPRFQET